MKQRLDDMFNRAYKKEYSQDMIKKTNDMFIRLGHQHIKVNESIQQDDEFPQEKKELYSKENVICHVEDEHGGYFCYFKDVELFITLNESAIIRSTGYKHIYEQNLEIDISNDYIMSKDDNLVYIIDDNEEYLCNYTDKEYFLNNTKHLNPRVIEQGTRDYIAEITEIDIANYNLKEVPNSVYYWLEGVNGGAVVSHNDYTLRVQMLAHEYASIIARGTKEEVEREIKIACNNN